MFYWEGQRGSKWVKVGQSGSKWVKVRKSGSKWVKVGQSGSKCVKVLKALQDSFYMKNYPECFFAREIMVRKSSTDTLKVGLLP